MSPLQAPGSSSDHVGSEDASDGEADRLASIEAWIEHAAHYLPSQGPITVFVHHNTLHAFEDEPFERAVAEASAMYGCEPYLAEGEYRRELERGRIRQDDLSWALLETLEDEADRLIGFMGTRYHLRLAMLEHPLRLGSDAELRWVIAETDALRRFRSETPAETRLGLVDQTRRWIMRDYADGRRADAGTQRDLVETLLASREFRAVRVEHWPDSTWEAFTLTLLWQVCRHGAHCVRDEGPSGPKPVRHRDFLLAASGIDVDLIVHDLLIRFNGAFLDQGFAAWTLPGRDAGYYRAFLDLYRDSRPISEALERLPQEIRRLDAASITPIQSIAESLDLLGVRASEAPEYLRRTLLALRGWAGIIRQLETNAEWAARPAPAGTLDQGDEVIVGR